MEDNSVIVQKVSTGEYTLLKKDSRSVVWKYFFEIQRDDGSVIQERVYCQVCQKLLKFANNQVSNLLKHKCVHSPPLDSSPMQLNAEDINACFQVFLEFGIEDCRPFSIVEGTGFRKLVAKCMQIGSKYGENVDLASLIPSASALSQHSKLVANEKRLTIKPHIQDLIRNCEAAVAVDLWTDDLIKRHFLCVTLHFQFEYEIVQITLGIKSMEFAANTPDNIRRKIKTLFQEFDVADISNAVFVAGNGSNIASALHDCTRLNCSAQLFSDVLDDAFESTKKFNAITKACKEIVKYLKKSKNWDASLKSTCTTRWNSNFAMFQSIFDNYATVSEILADNEAMRKMFNIKKSVFQALVVIYNDFEIIFKKLQCSASPTLCFVIPSINRIKMMCTKQENEEPIIAALKSSILTHLDKWTSNLDILHKVALFLYPPATTLLANDINTVKEYCIKRLQTIFKISPESPKTAKPSLVIQDVFSLTASGATTANDTFFFPTLIRSVSKYAPESAGAEVERYCHENVLLTDPFDVMLWWKDNSGKYPRLSKFATSILSIPASSTATERILSLCGNIVTEKRNRLESKTSDSILFLNSLLTNSPF